MKNENFSNKSFFFLKLFLKQELEKISGMFIKCITHMVAMATYFSQNFVKNENFSNQAHFFFILFLKQECKKKISGMFKECYTHIIMVAMITYIFFQNFCEI